MNLEEQWQGWRSGFDRTHNGVVRLLHDRAIWRTILAMLDAKPRVPRAISALDINPDTDDIIAISSVIRSDALFALQATTVMVRSSLGMGGPW